MSQNFNILFIIIAAIVAYLYLRKKKIEFIDDEIFLFILGLILLLIGSLTTYLSRGFDILQDYLLLRGVGLAGKFIIGSYIAFLTALFIAIERNVVRMVKSFRKQ